MNIQIIPSHWVNTEAMVKCIADTVACNHHIIHSLSSPWTFIRLGMIWDYSTTHNTSTILLKVGKDMSKVNHYIFYHRADNNVPRCLIPHCFEEIYSYKHLVAFYIIPLDWNSTVEIPWLSQQRLNNRTYSVERSLNYFPRNIPVLHG